MSDIPGKTGSILATRRLLNNRKKLLNTYIKQHLYLHTDILAESDKKNHWLKKYSVNQELFDIVHKPPANNLYNVLQKLLDEYKNTHTIYNEDLIVEGIRTTTNRPAPGYYAVFIPYGIKKIDYIRFIKSATIDADMDMKIVFYIKPPIEDINYPPITVTDISWTTPPLLLLEKNPYISYSTKNDMLSIEILSEMNRYPGYYIFFHIEDMTTIDRIEYKFSYDPYLLEVGINALSISHYKRLLYLYDYYRRLQHSSFITLTTPTMIDQQLLLDDRISYLPFIPTIKLTMNVQDIPSLDPVTGDILLPIGTASELHLTEFSQQDTDYTGYIILLSERDKDTGQVYKWYKYDTTDWELLDLSRVDPLSNMALIVDNTFPINTFNVKADVVDRIYVLYILLKTEKDIFIGYKSSYKTI